MSKRHLFTSCSDALSVTEASSFSNKHSKCGYDLSSDILHSTHVILHNQSQRCMLHTRWRHLPTTNSSADDSATPAGLVARHVNIPASSGKTDLMRKMHRLPSWMIWKWRQRIKLVLIFTMKSLNIAIAKICCIAQLWSEKAVEYVKQQTIKQIILQNYHHLPIRKRIIWCKLW